MLICPDDGVLRFLGTDTYGDATFAAIEEHVTDCPACKVALERLACRHPESIDRKPDPVRWPDIPGFEIRAELGRGGMGVVYLAIQTGPGRLVALKILPKTIGPDDADARRRWLRESRAISSVRHPNIVSLHDCGEADDSFFIVLEFIPGGTLKQRLTEPLPSGMAAQLMETIARAVAYIHSCGLLHLDLKPSNILLDGDKLGPLGQATPKISDFGLALSSDGTGASERSLAGIRGTPAYMAPEQAAGASADVGRAADIHALGALLYELLTGRPPFRGASTVETLDQVRNQNPVPPRRLNPKIPRDLETITLKCLEKKPSARYASAEAFASDLRCWLDDRPIEARPVSAVEHATRWCRHRPAVAALAAALALTLSVGYLVLALLWRRAESARFVAESERSAALLERSRAEQQRIQVERERTRADEGSKTAIEALVALVELGWRDLNVKGSAADHVIARLATAQTRLKNLADGGPNDPQILRLLAANSLVIATTLELQGKSAECCPPLVESLAYWEKILEKSPHDPDAVRAQWDCHVNLGRALGNQGNLADSIRHWEQAVHLGESLLANKVLRLENLVWCRRDLARVLVRSQDYERARTIFEGTLRLFGSVPSGSMTPIEHNLRAEARVELTEVHQKLTQVLEKNPPREFDDLSDHDWVERMERLLCDLADPDDVDEWLECGSRSRVVDGLRERATSERHAGKLDEARRTADRIHAYAQHLIARYPDRPLGQIALANAYEQRAKNAIRIDDVSLVELNRKLAIEAVQSALRIDPRSAEIRERVTLLEQRLDDFLAEKAANARAEGQPRASVTGS